MYDLILPQIFIWDFVLTGEPDLLKYSPKLIDPDALAL